MLFISDAIAQTADAAPQTDAFASIMPLVLIFAIFYFLLIRPQQKKLKEHEQVIKGLKKGDEVITSGGILGKITSVEEGTNIIQVEISPSVIVRISRTAVTDLNNKKEEKAKPAADKATDKKEKKTKK